MSESPLASWLAALDQPRDTPDADAEAGPASEPRAAAPRTAPGVGPGREPDRDPWAAGEPRPRRQLVVAAAVPWVLLLGVAAVTLGGGEADPATARSEPETSASPETPASSAAPPDTPGPDLTRPDGSRTDVPEDAAHLALVAVRVGAGADRHVESAAVVAGDVRAGGLMVVEVAAAVRDAVDGSWSPPRASAHTVVLRRREGRTDVLAGPWPVDPPTLDGGPPAPGEVDPDGVPPDDEALAAVLTAAGFQDLADVDAQVLSDGLVRVALTARGPGEAAASAHDLLLEDTPDGWVPVGPR